MALRVLGWIVSAALAGCTGGGGDTPQAGHTALDRGATTHTASPDPDARPAVARDAAPDAARTPERAPESDADRGSERPIERPDGAGEPPRDALAGLGRAAADPVARDRPAEARAIEAPVLHVPPPTPTVTPAHQPPAADDASSAESPAGGTIGLARPGIVGYGAGTAARAVAYDVPTVGRSEPVGGALGLSSPIQLYTFRADPDQGLSAHPVQCRAERILETVTAVVNRSGESCEAQHSRLAQAGVDLANITCRLPEDVPGCQRMYIGTVWVERDPGTLHDYRLQAFGRLARRCGARVEGVHGSDRRVTRHGVALGRLFDLCGQRMTGEATSTSASAGSETGAH